MKHQLTDISAVRKRLEIEIPQDVVDEEITRIAREIGRRARVPGFRPGKAPIGIVKNRYRDDILSETCQQLLPKYFVEAATDEGLKIVDQPSYDDIDHGKDRPLKFSATFEVFPQLDVTNHTGIPVEAVPTEVTDSEVDDAVKRLLEKHSEMRPVNEDRPVATGDFVEITFSGALIDEAGGEPDKETVSGEKALCEIGGETTVREFTENLTGTEVGEDKSFKVTYGDDHPDPQLAGKTARYDVHVEAVKTKHLPTMDDEFAAGVGDYKTSEELLSALRSDLEAHKKEHAEQQIRQALLAWLEEHNDFEVPEALVEQQLQLRFERLMRDLHGRGINPRGLDVDWARIRQDQYDGAVRDVRGSLILEHLAEREHVEVSDEEVDAKIAQMAEDMNQPVARIREMLEKDGGMDRMRDQLRHDRVFALLEAQARFVEAGSLSKSGSPG